MSGILLICGGCERHVKNGDCLCPFCGTTVACVADGASKAPAGLSRAALLALGAAGVLSTAIAGCYAEPAYGAPSVTSGGGYGGESQTVSTGQNGVGGAGQTGSSTGQSGSGGGGGIPDAGTD